MTEEEIREKLSYICHLWENNYHKQHKKKVDEFIEAHKQALIEARIEELENMVDDASEYYNQKRYERIAQLKKEKKNG